MCGHLGAAEGSLCTGLAQAAQEALQVLEELLPAQAVGHWLQLQRPVLLDRQQTVALPYLPFAPP